MIDFEGASLRSWIAEGCFGQNVEVFKPDLDVQVAPGFALNYSNITDQNKGILIPQRYLIKSFNP